MNRYSNVSTSSFKPLSLDEIMAVPLAKQAQQDASMLALDEFSKMESNSLDADKPYVTGQIQAFQKESDDLSTQLLESGVDRNLQNKIRGLRNRKNQEFSLEGKTGQASAAYNQYKANEKTVMARKDLTDDQKRAGLAKAKNDYLGVVEGGQYQDYIGSAHIDIMKKGREIAEAMTPEEKAEIVGMTYDPKTKFYSDGTHMTKTLTAEHIQKVVYQGLKGDRLVTDYANELQELGIESDADAMLRDSAINAGNVYQVSINKDQAQYRAPVSKAVDSSKKYIDPSQAWMSTQLINGQDAYNRTFNINEDDRDALMFDANGNITNSEDFSGAKMTEETWSPLSGSMIPPRESMAYKKWKDDKGRNNAIKQEIDKLRFQNPEAYKNKNDSEVYNDYVAGKQQASIAYSQVINPYNDKNTFYAQRDRILGNGTVPGSAISRRAFKLLGDVGVGLGLNATAMGDQLGYDDLQEFSAVLGEAGNLMGLSPADADFPMGYVVQIPYKDPDDGMATVILSPDRNISKAYPDPKHMIDNINNGTQHEVVQDRFWNPASGEVEPYYKHFVNRVNPKTGQYESKIVGSKTEFSQEELKNIAFDPATGATYINGEKYDDVQVLTYEDVVQESIDGITRMFDGTPSGATSVAQGLKN